MRQRAQMETVLWGANHALTLSVLVAAILFEGGESREAATLGGRGIDPRRTWTFMSHSN